MKKALALAAVICCVLVLVVVVHSQSAGSGSFSGTVAGQPVSGTFSTSTTDPCSSSAVSKSSAALLPNTSPVIVGVLGQAIYLCGFSSTVSGSGGESLSYGTVAQCSANAGIPLASGMGNGGVGGPVVTAGNNNQTILFVPIGNSLCTNGNGQGFVTYVQR